MRLLKQMAFRDLHAHRFWLDVKQLNTRALALYASEGFVEEGRLRESVRVSIDGADGYDSLVVMSMLDREYQARVALDQEGAWPRPHERRQPPRSKETPDDRHDDGRAAVAEPSARARRQRSSPRNPIVSRLPDKSLRRHSYGRVLPAHARAGLGAAARWACSKGERVATLCWNHHAHLEAYFGIPAAGGVMHTLNLRLAPDEIGWIAADAQDRFLIVDDILLPLYRQFAHLHAFEQVIVFPFSGAPVPDGLRRLRSAAGRRRPGRLRLRRRTTRRDPMSMCYTSGTTGRPKGVVYSHRSTVLHTLVGCLGDYAGPEAAPTWCCR